MSSKKRKLGLPPGSIYYTGTKSTIPVTVKYVEYDADSQIFESFDDEHQVVLHESRAEKVQWYDIRGLHDDSLIRAVGERFKMHPLAMEDSADVYNRPLYMSYNSGEFITLKSLKYDDKTHTIIRQHITIYLGDGFVISFQEHDDDLFEAVRNRIKVGAGRLRLRQADYLAYALIDFVVDQYFSVIDGIEARLTSLEMALSTELSAFKKQHLFALKKEILIMRKTIVPLREAIGQWSRSDSEVLQSSTIPYIRDVYDHVIHLIENVDSLKDNMAGLHDLYHAEASMQMNQVMQFLTITTAIFVPLSFLTGMYGMNFVNMPELQHEYGYFIFVGLMLLIAVAMVYWFRIKRWL